MRPQGTLRASFGIIPYQPKIWVPAVSEIVPIFSISRLTWQSSLSKNSLTTSKLTPARSRLETCLPRSMIAGQGLCCRCHTQIHAFQALLPTCRLTRTIPKLTRVRATISVGLISSPSIRAPLRNTPKTGVKNEKAWRRLTGYR
jgi:hypothetical protein